jgi:hypothetical protein
VVGSGVAGAPLWRWLADGAYWVGLLVGVSGIFLVSGAVQVGTDASERRHLPAKLAKLVRELSMQRAGEASTAPPEKNRIPASDSDDSQESIHVSEVEPAVRRLLGAYRGVLRFIERLPVVERRDIRTLPYWATVLTRRRALTEKRRLIIRPLVRFFAEAHVRRQLLHLIRVLRVETLGRDDTDERSKALRGLLAALTEAEQELFGWGRLRAAFARAPFLPAALAFALAVYNVASGIDLSNGGAFGKSAADSAKTLGRACSAS